jgi:curved DNA-binding protein CbpA
VPPSELEESTEGVDLTLEQQKKIVELFGQLSSMSLYDLLGVPRAADKKAIKRAYNEQIMLFHPDRFFRKQLGSFKVKMEAIVAKMTEAHDVLCSTEDRARYDATSRANRASKIDAMLEESAAEMLGAGEDAKREVVFFDEDIALEESVAVDSSPPLSSDRRQTKARPDSRLPPPKHEPRSGERPKTTVPAELSVTRPPASKPPAGVVSSKPPPSAPSSSGGVASMGQTLAQLRGLHEKRKQDALTASDRELYDYLRDDFAKTFLIAQRLTLKPGQAYRQALRVSCSLKVKIMLPKGTEEGLTVDLSSGGLAALIGKDLEVGTRCEFFLHVPKSPIRGTGQVVASARNRMGSSLMRVSLSFDVLDAKTSERLDILVLDAALAAMKL